MTQFVTRASLQIGKTSLRLVEDRHELAAGLAKKRCHLVADREEHVEESGNTATEGNSVLINNVKEILDHRWAKRNNVSTMHPNSAAKLPRAPTPYNMQKHVKANVFRIMGLR